MSGPLGPPRDRVTPVEPDEASGVDTSSGDYTLLNHRQFVYVSWLFDVLVYIVVLNVYVEFSPNKVIDSFTVSVFTAVVLKLLLVVITSAKKRVWAWSKQRDGRFAAASGVIGVWLILFLSKFLILETIDFIFGDAVELGPPGASSLGPRDSTPAHHRTRSQMIPPCVR